jgi:cytochrome d ubiquinol oxidase subunit II
MNLADLWFALFVVIIAGYLVLDGFDLGVGILYPFVARTDEERRLTLNSIGPIWDGNEVWLVMGGGVLFAAFPVVYAALFSGFYGAMMLVLLCLILRTVAIEFRSKLEGGRWRSVWDAVFFLASAALTLLLGVAFGNIIVGVPVDQQGNLSMSVTDLLGAFPVWLGLTTVVMLAAHGAHYLNVKTEGDVQARCQRWLPPLGAVLAVMGVVTVGWLVAMSSPVLDVYQQIWPVIFPIGAGIAFGMGLLWLRRGRESRAFVASAALIVLLLFSVGVGLYPNLLASSIDPAYSLTVQNASSADNTLTVMLIVAIIGIPFILLYTASVYYIFRGKVRLSPHSY